MEIASLVLGIVPIIVKALESYSKLNKLLQRYKKCRTGVSDLRKCLRTQELIFKNETRLLLSPFIGIEKSKTILENLNDPAWEDLSNRIEDVLGDMSEELRCAASRVYINMRTLRDELVGLDTSSEDLSETEAEGSVFRKTIRRKFRYAFSEKRLAGLQATIRDATADFRVLRSQVQELSRPRPARKIDVSEKAVVPSERVKATRAAAKRMYEALSKACTLHIQHQAHISLLPRYNPDHTIREIKFKLAFHQGRQAYGDDPDGALWFMVETIIADPRKHSLPLKRPPPEALEISPEPVRKAPKRVRFDIVAPVVPKVTANLECSASFQSMPKELLDLTQHHNFCTHLRQNCNPTSCESGMCIGFLGEPGQGRLTVYSSSGPGLSVPSTASKFNDLSTLLTAPSQYTSRLGRIPIVQRLQYAKLLSQAVLDFFATPWMQSPWSSKDIIIYNTTAASASSSTGKKDVELFVDVPVCDLTHGEPNQPHDLDPPFIHNVIMFKLGVVLLELAHEQPIEQMRIESEQPGEVSGMPPSTADYLTAFRRAQGTSSCLGPKYSDIVRKCLHCDFGNGCDLQNPSLQDAIHREVVSELDRLETGLRSLEIS